MTREEMLEAALRIALRKLGGEVDADISHSPALERRPAEGEIDMRLDSLGRIRAHLPGVLTPDECIAILAAMDRAEDPIVAVSDEGWIRYRSAAGHTVDVFEDCSAWDYIEVITHADGRRWEFDDDCIASRHGYEVADWSPSEPSRWYIDQSGDFDFKAIRRATREVSE